MAYSGMGTGKIQISLELIGVPENKGVLKEWWGNVKNDTGNVKNVG